MGWQRATVAQAIVDTLTAASEGALAVFADPPPSFNVPAYIVAWPTQVLYNDPAFAVDTATLPVIAAVAVEQSAQLDNLLDVARAALDADPTLGGLLAHGVVVVGEQRNWRILTDVAGARFLAGELILTVRM
jgi:hypothetical protein